MKTVGKRTRIPASPEEAFHWAAKIIAAAFRVSPVKKPRGFVVKFKTPQDYEDWRLNQQNPRLW